MNNEYDDDDQVFRDRLRTLLSVDDLVEGVVGMVEQMGEVMVMLIMVIMIMVMVIMMTMMMIVQWRESPAWSPRCEREVVMVYVTYDDDGWCTKKEEKLIEFAFQPKKWQKISRKS